MHTGEHRFRIGQTVKIVEGFGYMRAPDTSFKIIALLPSNGAHFQYKIRNAGESFDRTIRENELTAVSVQ
jgi:hypothetical protein